MSTNLTKKQGSAQRKRNPQKRKPYRPRVQPPPNYRRPGDGMLPGLNTNPIIMQAPKKKKIQKRKQKKEKSWWDTAIDVAASTALKYGPALIAGLGDYQVQNVESNSVLAAATNGSYGAVPIIDNEPKGSRRTNIVPGREYIGDVYGSTDAFHIQTFNINPGEDLTFPWLAPQAHCYTGYKMRGLMFEFISNASEYSSTPYLGYVSMATQYDAIEPDFSSKREMLNSEYANSGKPSENLLHPVECAKSENVLGQLYVRISNSGAATSDKRFYDLGRFSIATGGQTSNGKIGELWATYEVEFVKPRMSSTIASAMNMDMFSVTGADATHVLGSTTATYDYSTLGGYVTNGTTYNFPKILDSGYFHVQYYATGNGFSSGISIAGAGCNLVDLPLRDATVWEMGAGVTYYVMDIVVKLIETEASFTFGAMPGAPTFSTTALYVTQLPTRIFNTMSERSLSFKSLKDKKESESSSSSDDSIVDERTDNKLKPLHSVSVVPPVVANTRKGRV